MLAVLVVSSRLQGVDGQGTTLVSMINMDKVQGGYMEGLSLILLRFPGFLTLNTIISSSPGMEIHHRSLDIGFTSCVTAQKGDYVLVQGQHKAMNHPKKPMLLTSSEGTALHYALAH
jgi:hypothetical protein